MRILVTGGAGFIGSHVVDIYIQAGHEVWALDDLSRGRQEQVNPHARFVRMDLRSPDLKALLAEGRFDCVNHHAAQIDVRVSVVDPTRDAMVNIVGTLNLLEAMRAVGVPRVIFASTGGAIYGAQRRFPADEQHPTAPQSPYGVAKLAVELYLEYYRQVHDLHYTILRYANVYGPRQDPEGEAGVVAIFARRLLTHQQLVVYGDGSQTRDYVYVGDVARANLCALDLLCHPATPEPIRNAEADAAVNGLRPIFNVGTGIETSVTALAAALLDLTNGESIIVHQPARPGEQARSCIDPARAQEVFGWKPTVSLVGGLRRTLEWFHAHRSDSVGAAAS